MARRSRQRSPVSKSKYTVNKGKKGTYSVKGKRIKFKTGSYKGVWVGNWEKKNVIYLAQPSTPKENDVTCSRGK